MLANKLNTEYLSIGQLNNLAKNYLENNFSNVAVLGEISKFVNHSSGHWYFTIKDSNASVDCTMFASYNRNKIIPKIGNQIIVIGKLTIYQQNGKYQINCTNFLIKDQLGKLQQNFDILYSKLKNEGLFDDENKQKLPKSIKKLAIITAKDSAAAKDIMKVYEYKQSFCIKLVFFYSLMQGENAAKNVISNIEKINNYDFDAILIARGGGSKEDLFCFNDEGLIRTINKSKIPIITGLGHEINIHLSDLAATKYFATPTAAMEFLCYSKENRINYLENTLEKMQKIFDLKIKKAKERFLYFNNAFKHERILARLDMLRQKNLAKQEFILKNIKTNINKEKYHIKNYQKLISLNSKNILYKKKAIFNKYAQNITYKKLNEIINFINQHLKNYENSLRVRFENQIKNEKIKLSSISHKEDFIKVRIDFLNNNLIRKKEEIAKSLKNRLKNEKTRIYNYEQVLSTHKSLFENLNEYVKIIKNGKTSKLCDLKIGDKIILKNNQTEKLAQIIKE